MRIKALIIEDEPSATIHLTSLLEKHLPQIDVLGSAISLESGADLITELEPELIFLDIELPGRSGLQIFDVFPKRGFDVIFTTGFHHHSVQAFRLAALDYLTKPLVVDEVINAVDKHIKNVQLINQAARFEVLQYNLSKSRSKLALPSVDGFEIINCDDIVWCGASGSYSILHMLRGEKHVTSHSLKILEEALNFNHFVRVHHGVIVNLHFCKRFIKSKKPRLVLENGIEIEVSHRKKQDLIDRIRKLF
jgi:two-component system, LytTR family, response regulator